MYNLLSSSGLRVSKLALGTALLGVAPQEKEAANLITAALDAGLNFLDTANTYGNQERFDRDGAPQWQERRSSEEIIGEVIAGRRADVVLGTKVSEAVGDGPNDGGWKGGGLSRSHILRSIDSSLDRLETDYIDIYHAHHPDPATAIEETLLTFTDLIRQGMIHYYALSTFDGWQVTEAVAAADRLGIARPICHQTKYNLAKRWVETEVAPATQAAGLSLTAFSPLAGGLLTGKHKSDNVGDSRWGGSGFSEDEIRLGEKYTELSAKWSLPPAQLAIAWLLAKPAVASVIVGPESAAELHELLPAAQVTLTQEQLSELDALGPKLPTLWAQ